MHFEVDENKRIILARTLEYLFKDYMEGTFQTEIIDLGEAVGREEW